MSEGQVNHAAVNLSHLASALEREIEDVCMPGMVGRNLRKAIDAYVDLRIGYILSQTTFNGAQLIRVGECPSP